MAYDVIFSEGFDNVGTSSTDAASLAADVNNSPTVSAGSRFGVSNASIRLDSNGEHAQFQWYERASEGYASFYVRVTTLNQVPDIRIKDTLARTHIYLDGDAGSARWVVRHGDGSTIEAATASIISAGVWHHVEFYFDIHDTTGAYELRVDGVEVAKGSGVDTRNGGNADAGFIQIYNASWECYFDDIVVQGAAGTWLGEHRIRTVVPDGDGATTDFTPSTGVDNYAMVDDTDRDQDGTYNESSTVSDRDQLTLPDPGFAGQAVAVACKVSARKDDPGSTQLKVGIAETGGAEDLSAAKNVFTGSGYKEVGYISATNPQTTNPWTAADIAAADFIYEVA